MEAVAAFSLVCNVMQTIHFTCETVAACKSTFRTGDPDPSLGKYAKQSVQVYEDLRDSLVGVQPLNKDETELVAIAEDCLEAATALKTKLGKFSAPAAKGGRWTAIRRGVGAKFMEQRLDKLRRRMKDHQDVLESRLLVRVWYYPSCCGVAGRLEYLSNARNIAATRTMHYVYSKKQASMTSTRLCGASFRRTRRA